jgi:nitrate/nitrite transporter NarK
MNRSVDALRAVLRTPDLRRAQIGFAAFNIAELAVWIAMLVFAFERGGATEAGLVSVMQLVPAALVAPFLGTLADRAAPTKVQTAAYVAQALAVGATAAVLALDGPDVVAYCSAAIATMAFTTSRPTQAVLTPTLSRSALGPVAVVGT